MWTDSHCHIDYDGIVPDAIASAVTAGVGRMITVGTDPEHSAAGIAAARAHEELFATVGLHPHEAIRGVDGLRPLLDPLEPVIVGIGECGLDYYYEHSPRPAQREAFAAQIQMAAELDLTLVIHTRDAWDETFDILDGERLPDRWVLHCFTGGPEEALKVVDRGGYLSFSGIVTFKNAGDVRAAAAACPADRIMVETDSPFLAPVPNRGQPNRPGWVPLVGAAVAAARGLPVQEVEKITWDNATVAFNLPGLTLTRRQIGELLAGRGLVPSRALGQNFVADPNTVRRIARLAGVGPGDRVLEIGAGLGSLTLALVETGVSVTAVEADRHLVPVLREVLADRLGGAAPGSGAGGVRIVHADAMKLDWVELLGPTGGWVMVANLPYNIATPLVADLLDGVPSIERMTVMVQREVAERLVARPGDPGYGAVSVKVSYWAEARLSGRVPASVFVPQPKIESALVDIRRRPEPLVDPGVVPAERLFALVRAGFATRRKMLRRSLAGLAGPDAFAAAGVAPEARAEDLDVQAWGRLAVAAGPGLETGR